MHKKSLEKEELCQRLKEQLDALEKETASKLAEMDAFNSQLKVSVFSQYIVLHWQAVSLFLHPIIKMVALPPDFQKTLPNFWCRVRISQTLGIR